MENISKKLFRKETRLAQMVLTPIFLTATAMTLIPNYPVLVGCFMVCLGIFYSFQNMREQNDILFSILLPVSKRDIVSAKYHFVCFYEGLAFLLFIVMTVIRMTVLSSASVYAESVLLAPSPVFLAFALLVFAAFNVFFVGGFLRTAWKLGKPLIFFGIACLLLTVLSETLPHLPGLEFLQKPVLTRPVLQFSILGAALAVFAVSTFLSWKNAVRNFEIVDL